MLTKKECLNSYALLTLCVGNITETKIFKQLIEEHFELVEKYKRFKELSNLSDGVSGMKEVSICFTKETPSINDIDKNMRIVWDYFKDKKNEFDDVEIQGWKVKDDKIYILFDLPYSGNEYCLDCRLSASELINELLKCIILDLESMHLTIEQYVKHLESKRRAKYDE